MDGGWGGTPPLVLGHEAAGVVQESGSDVAIPPGTRVIVTLLRACGACVCCDSGMPALCEGTFVDSPTLRDNDNQPVGVGLKTAAFAEQVVVHDSQIAAIPDDLPFAQACLLSCGVITGWGAVVNTARVRAAATVAVVGCGGVGLNCLQAAAAVGATPIVGIDTAAQKLQLATQFGATHTVHADDDMPQTARAITGGRGFDYVFMAAGNARAVEQSAQLAATMGTIVLVGMPADGDVAAINAANIAAANQRILGSKMGGACLRLHIPQLIAMYRRGQLKLRELIGEHYPLADINIAVADAKKGGALRNIIVF